MDGFLAASHDVIVDSVFHVHRGVLSSEKPLVVCFVLSEEQRYIPIDVEPAVAQIRVGSLNYPAPARIVYLSQRRLDRRLPPAPRIPEPERRNQMQFRR